MLPKGGGGRKFHAGIFDEEGGLNRGVSLKERDKYSVDFV
jgi:hypothetical protein